MGRQMGRRHFLGAAAAAVAGPLLLPRRAWAANEQITLGCIGMGGHGTGWNLAAFLKLPEARVLAVCDVFRDRREAARDRVNAAYGTADCQAYTDFRDILARPDIDAVVISTPDHWHVLLSVMAARAGKHVFCEKPTLTVEEGQILVRTLRETGVVYQGGIEDRSVDVYHRMAELARNGCLGRIARIHITLLAGEVFPKEAPAPVPEGLDYDLWLGPAPESPYTPSKLGPQQWRNQWDYAGGKLADWGAHQLDTAHRALGQTHGGPLRVDGKGTFPEDAMTTNATDYRVVYEYPGGVEVVVESGGTGIRIEGAGGWVDCPKWRAPLEASSPDLLETVIDPAESALGPRPPSEHEEFLDGVKGRRTPTYTPMDIHRLSTPLHLGNISMRLGRPITWDPERETCPGDGEANAYLSRPLRKPWGWGS